MREWRGWDNEGKQILSILDDLMDACIEAQFFKTRLDLKMPLHKQIVLGLFKFSPSQLLPDHCFVVWLCLVKYIHLESYISKYLTKAFKEFAWQQSQVQIHHYDDLH
jgi:hypothetical protein